MAQIANIELYDEDANVDIQRPQLNSEVSIYVGNVCVYKGLLVECEYGWNSSAKRRARLWLKTQHGSS